MCLSLNLVQPTQRLHDLELQHLQRVALSPHLFSKLVDANGHSQYEERPVLSPKSTTSLGGESTAPLNGMELLRGGRYLVTWEGTSVDHHLLQVWDVGVPGRRLLLRPRVIGALQVDSHEFNIGDWVIDQEGDSVRLAIITNASPR